METPVRIVATAGVRRLVLAMIGLMILGETAAPAFERRDLTLLTMRRLKYDPLAEYEAPVRAEKYGSYGGAGYSNAIPNASSLTNRPGRPPTALPPGPIGTNGTPNPWTNAIIIDLPHPGTVVNLSGAFLRTDLTNIVAISAGKHHALALREDLSVVSWGNQIAHDLALTNVPIHLTNTLAICAGDDYCLALQSDGTVASWGSGICATLPVGLHGVVALAAGPQHAVALRFDGTIAAWGPRAQIPSGVSDVKAIAASEFHTLVARRDGSVQAYGPTNANLTGAPTNAVSVVAGPTYYAMTTEKTVASFGSAPDPGPLGLTEVIAFSARNNRCLALRSDSSVVGWGNVSVPANLTNAIAISAGDLYCLVLIVEPPAPVLNAVISDHHLYLSAPLAVSGYQLESRTNLHTSWTLFDVTAHALQIEEAGHPFLKLPASAPETYFRLKRGWP